MYFRFMSKKEYKKLLKGKVLENHEHYHKHTNGSTSIGFCFMKMDGTRSISDCYDFLDGIVSPEVLVIFNNRNLLMRVTKGRYADLNSDDPDAMLWVKEYCVEKYSLKDIDIVKVYDFSKCEDDYEIEKTLYSDKLCYEA